MIVHVNACVFCSDEKTYCPPEWTKQCGEKRILMILRYLILKKKESRTNMFPRYIWGKRKKDGLWIFSQVHLLYIYLYKTEKEKKLEGKGIGCMFHLIDFIHCGVGLLNTQNHLHVFVWPCSFC